MTASPEILMFAPPSNRSMRILDRSFFRKHIPLSAARISEKKDIGKLQKALERSKDLLTVERIRRIQPDPDPELAAKQGKCFLLSPRIKHDDKSTWSPVLQEHVSANHLGVIPYELELDYSYWTYQEIMTSILPDDALDELPSGYNQVGHVAHLNLRSQYLPYKSLIAAVLLDKIPTVRTVINKIEDVGTKSQYRTFDFELLAGEPDYNVTVNEGHCSFRFDYSKVYWNSKLGNEHARLVDKFQEGEAVCDVMAGVGPFAVPAGKRRVFVWANDLNPDSHAGLVDAIQRNKVWQFVKPFNEDGRTFISHAVDDLLNGTSPPQVTLEVASRLQSNGHSSPTKSKKVSQIIHRPRTFNHFVMNLPASAITFLDGFIGVYKGRGELFEPNTTVKLPLIHVYCFVTGDGDDDSVTREVSRRIGEVMGCEVKPEATEMEVWDVRAVAPQKRMFCVSFRLPAEVAFRTR